MHILVAEDNPDNQVLINILLKKIGHTLDIASDGEETLSLALSRQYDLILMDLHMPKLNGFETTIAIREQSSSKIPIIALSADAVHDSIEKCKTVGMDDYLEKPIQKKMLEELLNKYS